MYKKNLTRTTIGGASSSIQCSMYSSISILIFPSPMAIWRLTRYFITSLQVSLVLHLTQANTQDELIFRSRKKSGAETLSITRRSFEGYVFLNAIGS